MKKYKVFIPKIVISKAFICSLSLATVLLLVFAVVSHYFDIPMSRFTRDPLAIAGGNPFIGFFSNVGVILWSSSMALCFFSYFILRTSSKSGTDLRFVISGGVMSLVLLLDDLFMLHEYIYPKYFGVGEKVVYLIYISFFLLYIVGFYKKIIETEFIYFVCFMLFFAFSILVDILPRSLIPWHHLFEDGFKFLGIISWLGYHFSVCYHEVRSCTNNLSTDMVNSADTKMPQG